MLILKVWSVTYNAQWNPTSNQSVGRSIKVIAEDEKSAREMAHHALSQKQFNDLHSCSNCRYVGKSAISSVLEDSPLAISDSQLKELKKALDALTPPVYTGDEDLFVDRG